MSLSSAIEIDVPFVKDQAQRNKDDVASRMILMKYYLQSHDYAQSKSYANEILALDAQNNAARALKKKVEVITDLEERSGMKHAPVSVSLHKLFNEKAFQTYIEYYEKLGMIRLRLDENVHYDAAYAYFKMDEYAKSSAILKNFPYSKNRKMQALKDKISLGRAEKNITSTNTPQALNDYIYLLNKEGDKKATVKKLQAFVKAHPENVDAKIALAQNIYWAGDRKKAFHILYPVRKHTHDSKKLYANILYELGDYEHALYFLPEVSRVEKSVKEKYSLQKRTAFSYMHVGKKEQAEKIFKTLIRQNPQDKDIVSYQERVRKDALLSDAIQAHKRKDLTKALSLYRAYHDKSADPKIAKEIAELYYFNKKEKLALPYYKAYLAVYPEDTLIRYHYASAFEKKKMYRESIPEFKNIVDRPSAKEYYLAKYHYSNSLMKTYKDADWYEARRTLKSLVKELDDRADPKQASLKKFSTNLLKIALGKVRKPTRYKDIVLTEGSYKVVNTKDVFLKEDIRFIGNPSSKSLLGIKPPRDKSQVWLGLDYADDSQMSYHNYKLGVDNLFKMGSFRYGMYLEKFDFEGQSKHDDGLGLFLKAQKDKVTLSLGLEHFDAFDTVVPRVSWNPTLGSHNLFMEAYYRNGAFVNYRRCMIEKETSVYHIGMYDSIVLDSLETMELGLDINHFEDDNTNFYGLFSYPLLSGRALNVEHLLLFNENIEYNTKTKVCSNPMEFYDTSYLKYKPKMRFRDGSVELSVGTGYSFKNKEVVYSYGFNGHYAIDKFATLALSCERLQSSFTTDDMNFCRLNVIQDW